MEKNLMKGNEALAESAIRCGCKCFFGYPITPQTEISAYMAKRMCKVGGVFLQAESEIAAINMVLGAAASGVRAMTSSSSPGISLKSEGVSYIAASDLPCLIVNVQRGGPGLGGIQPSQSDYWQATKAMGHGDFRILVYSPDSVQEMADYVSIAFDTAEKYRMPAMILADGLLGQMMEPVAFSEKEYVPQEKPWATNGHGGKRKHNIINSLMLQPEELYKSNLERFERYKIVESTETRFENYLLEDADVAVVAYGATARIAKSAVNSARKKGIKAGLFRPVTLYPFPSEEMNNLIGEKSNVRQILCTEMNMGQMVDDIKLAVRCSRPVSFFGRTGGIIPTPEEILSEIIKLSERSAD